MSQPKSSHCQRQPLFLTTVSVMPLRLRLCFIIIFNLFNLAFAVSSGFQPPVSIDSFDGGFNLTSNVTGPSILTSYKYYMCSPPQQKVLQQAVEDGTWIAWQGLKLIQMPGTAPRPWLNFNTQSAIDFFGPPSENGALQTKISSKSHV